MAISAGSQMAVDMPALDGRASKAQPGVLLGPAMGERTYRSLFQVTPVSEKAIQMSGCQRRGRC